MQDEAAITNSEFLINENDNAGHNDALSPQQLEMQLDQAELDLKPGLGGENGGDELQQQQHVQSDRFARSFYPKKWHAAQLLAKKLEGDHPQAVTGSPNGQNGHSSTRLPYLQARFQLRGHRKHVSCVKVSPDGRLLASAGADGRILLFALPSSSCDSPPDAPPTFIKALTVPPPPRKLVAAGAPAYSSGGPIGSEGINDICFSPDSKLLASASDDKVVRLWRVDEETLQLSTGGKPDVVQDPPRNVRNPAPPAANGEPDDVAMDIYSGNLLANSKLPGSTKVMRGHTSFVACVAFSPQGNLLASGSYDETIRIWDVKKGKCLRVMPAHSDPVSAVHFSRDGTLLVSCGHDGLIRLWDSSTGQCLKSLVDEANPPASSARFTPNSRYILASYLDSTIRLWDYHVGTCVRVYTGHKNVKHFIPSMLLLPFGHPNDGNREADEPAPAASPFVMAGDEEGKINLWDLQTRKLVIQIEVGEDPVISIDVHLERGLLVSASLDRLHTVKLWYEQPSATVVAIGDDGMTIDEAG